MVKLPDPLVPAEVRFDRDTDFPFPGELLRFGRLATEPNARVFRAVVILMEWCWRGKPAGSVRDYDDRMHRLAMESPSWWKARGNDVLAHFVKCSDGQYYHPELSRLALSRWNRAVKGAPARFLDVGAAEWVRLRAQVFKRDNFTCQYCFETIGPFEADHIVALASGGRSTLSNLATACKSCNSAKGAKPLLDWLG